MSIPPENNTPGQTYMQLAVRWMTDRCAGESQCPLDYPTAPVRKLSKCFDFRKEAISACPRIEESDKSVAVIKDATCPHSQGR